MPELSTPILVLTLCGAVAYAIGSLPMGQFLSRCCFSGRHVRSAAFTKVFADQVKGFLVVYTACTYVGGDAAQLAAVMVYLGHVHPFIGTWSGGKGVGTLLGALTGLDPLLGLIALCAWLFTFFVFRFATFAMMMATLVTPPIAYMVGFDHAAAVLVLLASMQLWNHRAAIRELFAEGSEPMVDWAAENSRVEPAEPPVSKDSA